MSGGPEGVGPPEGWARALLAATDRTGFVAAACLAVLALHIFCASHLIARSNQDPARSDQGAELWLARVAAYHGDAWPRRTDGVRHPLWSWTARLVQRPATEDFFRAGKWLNTGVACGFLILLAAIGARSLGGLATLVVLLLASMGILLVRGTFFQPEPLYYLLSFCAAACAWRILAGGGWLWFPALGILAGLAMLAKPSFEPMALAFLCALLARAALRRRWKAAGADLAGVCAAGAVIAAMTYPLAQEKRALFGSHGFSYPKIWMWMDDFETEAWPWQTAHPGKAQLEKIPPGEIPSAAWYFRRHDLPTAFARLTGGTREVLARFFFPEPRRKPAEFFWKGREVAKWEQPLSHRGIYLAALWALAGALAVGGWRRLPERLRDPDVVGPLVFAVLAFGLYAALYGWYLPIGKGDRFMGSLWVPMVFLGAWLARRAFDGSVLPFRATAYAGTLAVLALSLALQAGNAAYLLGSGVTLIARN